MRNRLYSFLFFFGITICAHAQPAVGTWSITGPVVFPINVSGQVHGMGRVSQMKFHSSNPAKLYAVSASGGLFISNDTGHTWANTPGTDVLPQTSCSSVCVDYTDDNIIYLSTGDNNYYNQSYGIWKSTNGGLTFSAANTGIGNRMATEMIMDPTNHNTIIAATNNGVWRTTDAAATWTQTQAGAFRNLKRRPGSNTVLYAATDTTFFRSTNMGVSWTQITSGLAIPTGNGGLRIAVTPADTNLVFIGTTGGYGKVFKSTDGGLNFSLIYSSATQCVVCYDSLVTSGSQGNYNFDFTVNPSNANELLLVSHCVWRSTDGGYTWSWRTKWWREVHTDMHEIHFDPYDNNKRFNINDGGIWISTDPLATKWSPLSDGLSCTENYHSAQSPTVRQLVSAGTQDNGELFFDGIWKCNRGGDWTTKQNIDYLTKGTVYYKSKKRRNLSPLGNDYNYNGPFVTTPDFNVEFSKRIPNTGFIGTDSLWISRNINLLSPSWTFLYTLGEPIKAVEPSMADTNMLYLVTRNNHLVRSDNILAATPTFTMMTTPAATNVTASITTDRFNPNVVYMSCNSTVYKSFNKGVTWVNITGALPAVNITKIIADRYSTNGRIFLAQATKVWYKDSTTPWTLITGLPTVARISDLMIYNDSTAASILRVSTYGRGIWEVNIHNDMMPIGDFVSNKQYVCVGDTVRYNKTAYGNIASFQWNFPGGTPATSTADSPVVVYSTAGVFTPSLILYGGGSVGNDTISKAGYIVVSNGVTAPIVEGFESTTFPPTPEWSQQSLSGKQWLHNDTVGAYGTSAKSMFFDNFHNNAFGKHDRITIPKIDLTSADTAYITFDIAYAYSPGYNDSLSIVVSTDCGKTFTSVVYTKTGATLASAPNLTTFFSPGNTSWRKDTVWLTPYLGQDIMAAFDNIGRNGQPIYVDNVNIYVKAAPSSVAAILPENGLLVYPNPASNELFVTAGVTINNVTVTNQIGQKVYSGTTNGKDISIDISSLPSGLYFVKVNNLYAAKFLKQ